MNITCGPTYVNWQRCSNFKLGGAVFIIDCMWGQLVGRVFCYIGKCLERHPVLYSELVMDGDQPFIGALLCR